MTVATNSFTNSPVDAATIKSWGAAVSSMFSGAALAVASDSGQVNWATITPVYPATNQTSVHGYEVWKFTDSLQASKPVLLVVTYKTARLGGATANSYITVTVCTATNGAGTPTSTLNLTTIVSATDAAGATWTGLANFQSSGDGSYFNLALGTNFSAVGTAGLGWFYIDRTRDSTGAISGEGVVFGYGGVNGQTATGTGAGASNDAQSYIFGFSSASLLTLGIVNAAGNGVALPVAGAYNSMSAGSVVSLQTSTIICNGKLLPPILGMLAYLNTDITAGSTVAVTVSGAVHTYLCLGLYAPNASLAKGSLTSVLAMRYE